MSEPIRIQRTTSKKERPKDKDLAFGTVFTDHMFVADFEEEKGWYDPRVEPYGPLPLDPATAVLHYGQALFEGTDVFWTLVKKDALNDKQVFIPNKLEANIFPHLVFYQNFTDILDIDRQAQRAAVDEAFPRKIAYQVLADDLLRAVRSLRPRRGRVIEHLG